MNRLLIGCAVLALLAGEGAGRGPAVRAGSGMREALSGTRLLESEGDLAAQMVAGIDAFLSRELAGSIAGRRNYWNQDFDSTVAYERSVQKNRERLQIGRAHV